MSAPRLIQPWADTKVQTWTRWLTGSYQTSIKPLPKVVLDCDFSTRSISLAAGSMVVRVTYASWFAPNWAAFQYSSPAEPTSRRLLAIAYPPTCPRQLLPGAPFARLKPSSTPVDGNNPATAVLVGVGVLVGTGVCVGDGVGVEVGESR